jgi:pyridinium-3,5-bisthiocarboxylic acid mononucleotide nickel chelatase
LSILAHIDAPSGVAGDMILAALIDAGVPEELFEDVARRLELSEVSVTTKDIVRRGQRALHATVQDDASDAHPHRHLPDILRRIAGSGLPALARERAERAFRLLAEAEARVHGTSPDQVHFHEVGAVDALVDIVGAMAGFSHLGVGEVTASPLPMGHGTVRCAHGVLPLPAPAVAAMLPGVPVYGAGVEGETVTPTGLAILLGLEARFGAMPALTVRRTGLGCGTRYLGLPGPLRLFVGDQAVAPVDGPPRELNVEVQATIDDMNPEWTDEVFARLFEAGALDVYAEAIVMKKGRPAQRLTALAPEAREEDVIRAMLRHSRTIGVRTHRVEKRALPRRMETVRTRWGDLPIKIVFEGDRALRATPEHDALRALARRAELPLEEVERAACVAIDARLMALRKEVEG